MCVNAFSMNVCILVLCVNIIMNACMCVCWDGVGEGRGIGLERNWG